MAGIAPRHATNTCAVGDHPEIAEWCEARGGDGIAFVLQDGQIVVDVDNYAKGEWPAGSGAAAMADVRERAARRAASGRLERTYIGVSLTMCRGRGGGLATVAFTMRLWGFAPKEPVMALPALVLVHGGGMAADSWELTVDEIHRLAPELTVLAVDLPGRRDKPGDLLTVTIADFVESVIDDIEDAGLGDIVLVGHSIGGMTLPGVVTKLGAARVLEMIFAAAFLPPEGTSIADGLPWLLARIARRFVKRGVPRETPRWLVRFAYLNGVPSQRRRFMTGKLYPESLRILTEDVSRRGMPDDIPRAWILTMRDRALAPKVQRKNIEALGGVQTLIEIDTCHCLMVSEPERLADILVERCRLYAS